jgi:hypothetical protein
MKNSYWECPQMILPCVLNIFANLTDIYFPCIRVIWRFVHQRKVKFPEDYFEGEHIFISPFMQGKWMFYSTRPMFWWILPNEIFWPSLFTRLLFRNISGVIPLYDQSIKSWEFRIREIRCFDNCHVGLFRPIKFLYIK